MPPMEQFRSYPHNCELVIGPLLLLRCAARRLNSQTSCNESPAHRAVAGLFLTSIAQLQLVLFKKQLRLIWWPKRVHEAPAVDLRGGILYSDIRTYPHLIETTVFSALWPHSVALWGSLVLPYRLLVRLEAFAGT